jgi:hypothetical protein
MALYAAPSHPGAPAGRSQAAAAPPVIAFAGFGLSQVYGFVKQANGTISVESKETGTAITMKFMAVGRYRKTAV